MKFRWYVTPFLLAVAGLIFQSGCGNTPDPLPSDDTEEVDDLMDDMEVPGPDDTPEGDGTDGGDGGGAPEGDGTETPPA